MNKFIVLSLMITAIMTAACPNDEYCANCNGTSCVTCVNAYLGPNGECVEPENKLSNCYSYTSATACKACNSGYYLSGTGCAEINIDNCSEVNASAPTLCTMCDNGRLPINGSCNGGPECAIDNCDICKYSNSSTGRAATPANNADTNNANANNTNADGTNADGTNANNANADGTNNNATPTNNATPATNTSAQGTNADGTPVTVNCVICDVDYSSTSQGACIKEPTDNCLAATDANTCSICARGYYDNNNSCSSTSVQGSGVQIVATFVSIVALLMFL